MSLSGGNTDEDGETSIDVAKYAAKCWRFAWLYVALLALALVVALAYYICAPRQYTAFAVLGPVTSATPSSSSLVGSAVAMLGNKLSGGADAEQMFTEYSQLLTSTRLSQALIDKHDILKAVFRDQWDGTQKRWKIGPVRGLKNWLSDILGTYPKTSPDADDLDRYFDKHLNIEQVSPITSSSLLSTSSMIRVSFEFNDPYAAGKILGEILNEADSILRSDQKRDVDARIKHVENILPTITVADQRQALITVLSNQFETQTLIQSDKRYSSVLIDVPHASLTPTSPKLIQVMILTALLALLIATGLILSFPPEHRILRSFDRHKVKRS
jgi:LPS O-antigen subunit length determinant protein (WzzB/FepE family)